MSSDGKLTKRVNGVMFQVMVPANERDTPEALAPPLHAPCFSLDFIQPLCTYCVVWLC